MNISAQNQPKLSQPQKLQELQQAIQQMRAEIAQSHNMIQQITQVFAYHQSKQRSSSGKDTCTKLCTNTPSEG